MVDDAPRPSSQRRHGRAHARPLLPRVVPAALAAALYVAGGGGALALPATSADAGAPGARAQAGPTISTTGGCPGAETIWAAMSSLVPRGALESLPRAAVIDVADLGDTYRVRLTTGGIERVRVYRDLARDCDQRARFAAVFVVLTLMPPELLIDSPARLPEPEIVSATPSPAVSPARDAADDAGDQARVLRLELSALGDGAPAMSSAPEVASPGVELRAAFGRGSVLASIGAAVQASSAFTLGPLRARELRMPLDAGVRLRRTGEWIEIGGELAVVAALFRAEGVSPVVARTATGIDLGARAAATVRVGPRAARLAPIAGIHGAYFPTPFDLSMQPNGVVGHTPTFRFGATAGVAASF